MESEASTPDSVFLCVVSSGTGVSEHSDTQSYSWSLMRYACIKYIRHRLTAFLPKIGLELPGRYHHTSPHIHSQLAEDNLLSVLHLVYLLY